MNSISNEDIAAIISREEVRTLVTNNLINTRSLVLIHIAEPLSGDKDEMLPDSITSQFKESLGVRFWDLELPMNGKVIIDDSTAKRIQNFIIKNKNERFLVCCAAGQSRSAAVGKAIECIKHFGIGEENHYFYSSSYKSPITAHSRYAPNLTVFKKIVSQKCSI